MISIIIPVYNTAQYLRKCLDSVCQQTRRDLEIITVNDGSPDNALDILREYAQQDPRVIVISQENGGLSSARNTGLRHAHGDCIMFLDSDDWLDLNTCELTARVMEEDGSQVVMMSYAREYTGEAARPTQVLGPKRLRLAGRDAENLYRRMVGPMDEELRVPYRVDSFTTACIKLFRRSVIGNHVFTDTKLIGSEDVLFCINVFSSVSCVSYLPDCLYHYRKDNDASLTSRYEQSWVSRWEEMVRRIRAQLIEEGRGPEYHTALNNRICCGLIGLCLRLNYDSRLHGKEKRAEIKRLLSLPYYRDALSKMDRRKLLLPWKLFFAAAARQNVLGVYGLVKGIRLASKLL